jgi:hypothetical protein
MFASVCSDQNAIVSPLRTLRTATLVTVLAAALGHALPAAAESPASMARCQQLYGEWQRYKGASTNSSGRDVQSQAALLDCRNGRAEAGIAQLEQLLKDDRIPVPQVSSALR